MVSIAVGDVVPHLEAALSIDDHGARAHSSRKGLTALRDSNGERDNTEQGDDRIECLISEGFRGRHCGCCKNEKNGRRREDSRRADRFLIDDSVQMEKNEYQTTSVEPVLKNFRLPS